MKKYVFVYGTLKKGFGNSRVMNQAKGQYIGNGIMKNVIMRDIGGIPAVDIGDGVVYGEVYKIDSDNIYIIDGLEGFSPYNTFYDNMYIRLKNNVIMDNGDILKCCFYMINDTQGNIIKDGVW